MSQLPPTRGFFVGCSVSMARHQPSLTGGARLLDRRSADYDFGLPVGFCSNSCSDRRLSLRERHGERSGLLPRTATQQL